MIYDWHGEGKIGKNLLPFDDGLCDVAD